MRDALPFPMPISERISFLYFERASIEREGHSLVTVSGLERVQIPIGRTTVLMLGPGTSISHAAVSLCALEGALVQWVGEAGVRLYSASNQRSNTNAILIQAAKRTNDSQRLTVARSIYGLMFNELAPSHRSIDQLRGIEGAKVKEIYTKLAQKYGITWTSRQSDLGDPLNSAISTATSALYGVTEAAILALGYSPAIGFIHSGDPRSFVFDIADIIKFKTVVPLAFQLVAESKVQIEQRTRTACRDLFYQQKTPQVVVDLIERVIDAHADD
jgi:CRISP-associated protein Cas1